MSGQAPYRPLYGNTPQPPPPYGYAPPQRPLYGGGLPPSRDPGVDWIIKLLIGFVILAVVGFLAFGAFMVYMLIGYPEDVVSTQEKVTLRASDNGVVVQREIRPDEPWMGPIVVDTEAEFWTQDTTSERSDIYLRHKSGVHITDLTVNGVHAAVGKDGKSEPVTVARDETVYLSYVVPRIEGRRQVVIGNIVDDAYTDQQDMVVDYEDPNDVRALTCQYLTNTFSTPGHSVKPCEGQPFSFPYYQFDHDPEAPGIWVTYPG